MRIRNFWVEVEIDGRKHLLKGGPVAKEGGITIRVSQRNRGATRPVLTIKGYRWGPDELYLDASSTVGNSLRVMTTR